MRIPKYISKIFGIYCPEARKHWWSLTETKYIFSANRIVGFDFKKFRFKYEYRGKFARIEKCDYCNKERVTFRWKPKFTEGGTYGLINF